MTKVVGENLALLAKSLGYPQDAVIGVHCRITNKSNSMYNSTRQIVLGDLENSLAEFHEIYPERHRLVDWILDKYGISMWLQKSGKSGITGSWLGSDSEKPEYITGSITDNIDEAWESLLLEVMEYLTKTTGVRKKNWKVTDRDTGEIYWISRSMAVEVIIHGYRGCIGGMRERVPIVLVERRGPGCPDEVGKLCIPCGYLEWGETLKEAAVKEVYEETGLEIDEHSLKQLEIRDGIDVNKQNVVVVYKTEIRNLSHQFVDEFCSTDTKSRGGEDDEVSDIFLMSLEDIHNSKSTDWAFGHRELIIKHIKED